VNRSSEIATAAAAGSCSRIKVLIPRLNELDLIIDYQLFDLVEFVIRKTAVIG
jgi:hypothetical protein